MNQFGTLRLRHLQQTMTPEQLEEFGDLQKHCELVGIQAQDMLARRTEELKGQGAPVEGYLARMQREVTAARQAREQVMRELILTPAAEDPEQ